MFNRLISLSALFSLIVLIVMLNLTSPMEIGPTGVLVFFVALYITIYGVLMGLIRLTKRVTGKSQGLIKKDYYMGVVFSFGLIMLLLVQSFGTLNLFTVVLVILFVIISGFLVSKRL